MSAAEVIRMVARNGPPPTSETVEVPIAALDLLADQHRDLARQMTHIMELMAETRAHLEAQDQERREIRADIRRLSEAMLAVQNVQTVNLPRLNQVISDAETAMPAARAFHALGRYWWVLVGAIAAAAASGQIGWIGRALRWIARG